MKKLVCLLFAAILVAGCGEKSASESSESASEKPASSNENVEPSANTPKPSPAEPPVAESSIEEPSDTPNSLITDAPESSKAIDLDDPETLDKIISEAIDYGNLQLRERAFRKLFYAPNQQIPYTGWEKWMHDNGQIRGLTQYKDGKLDGPSATWHENGQKQVEATYKDGKAWTAVAWKPNGEKCPDTNVVNGNGVGVECRDDGTISSRETYKDGELISAKHWDKDGKLISAKYWTGKGEEGETE